MAEKTVPAHIGGSFAPPLTDELLAKYEDQIASLLPSAMRDGLVTLLTCVKKWWDLPESGGTKSQSHPSGRGTIVPLDEKNLKALDPHIPWQDEIDVIQKRCDDLEEKELRNAAFHLLWHVKELNLDREPLTHDKL